MRQSSAGEMVSGDDIILMVKVVDPKLRTRRCHPKDIDDNEIVISVDKTLHVDSVTPGESCKGIHVNEKRLPTWRQHKGQSVPNPEGRRMIHNDGCYDKTAQVWLA